MQLPGRPPVDEHQDDEDRIEEHLDAIFASHRPAAAVGAPEPSPTAEVPQQVPVTSPPPPPPPAQVPLFSPGELPREIEALVHRLDAHLAAARQDSATGIASVFAAITALEQRVARLESGGGDQPAKWIDELIADLFEWLGAHSRWEAERLESIQNDVNGVIRGTRFPPP